MKIKVGLMGAADDTLPSSGVSVVVREKAEALGQECAARNLVLLTGVGQVAAYRIDMNGRLVLLHRVGGIPAMAGATGLAAY